MQISAVGVGHRFDGQEWLFRGVDFTLQSGEIIGLLGPSGSGKSTVLSLLADLEKPVEGTVVRQNVQTVGWVFQNPVGVPRRTALDHVSYPLLLQGISRARADDQAQEILHRFGLEKRTLSQFRHLSGGEAQRLMLARAAACSYDALLIDEPTAQLDSSNARAVIDVITGLRATSRITVVATHDPRVITKCDRMLDLRDFSPSRDTNAVS